MNVSSRQGSCRRPVIRHRLSYSAYGSRPGNPAGDVIPNWRRSPATAGPTFGTYPSRAMASRLEDGRIVDDFRLPVASYTMDRTTPPSTRSAAPLVAEARGLHT